MVALSLPIITDLLYAQRTLLIAKPNADTRDKNSKYFN